MNTTLGIPLESFNLDEREFERSKVWSAVIKRYSTIEDDNEIDFDKLEAEFQEEVEDDGVDDDSAEVSLDEDKHENNPLNNSVMQLHSLRSKLLNTQPKNENGKCSSIGMMKPLYEDDDLDMQDILDQTIPILAERERKWKESGMLNILNTFDEEKIERKVGSWLRINSSIQAAHTMPNTQVQSQEDDDSLHSMDTARYILSNRKPRSSNCCSTIKSYRLLQSKRDALREKYAFSEDELERALRRHISEARSRNNLKAKNDCKSEQKFQRSGESELGKSKLRRKLFNKQRSRTWNSNHCCESSSSSGENYDDESDEPYSTQFRRLRRLPASSASLLQTPMGKAAISLPRSLFFSATAPRSSRFKPRQASKSTIKPRKRGSDFCCFKEEKLDTITEHLADTSPEGWLVENCDSPKKLTATNEKITNKPSEVKTTTTTKKKKTQIKNPFKKPVAEKKSKDISGLTLLESTFEIEIQKAIEISKQTYELERKAIKGPCAEPKIKKIKKTKLKTKAEKTKSIPKFTKFNSDNQQIQPKNMHNAEIAENQAPDTQLIQSTEPPEGASMETIEQQQSKQQRKSLKKHPSIQIQTQPKHEENSQKNEPETQEDSTNKQNKTSRRQSQVDLPLLVDIASSIIDDISPARLGLKPQPKSAKLKKIKKLNEKNYSATATRNETFYSQADKICNSTAMANDALALKKQFSTESIKSSTTANETTMKAFDEPDCTIVTSTTDDPQQRKLKNATYTTNNHGNRDILLYTPHNRNLAPPHSCSDGVFNITEEHLSAVIGEKAARKFMKYYIGRRRFDANLTVYYRPPRRLGHNNSNGDDDETDSDVDALEQINNLGDLYVIFDK